MAQARKRIPRSTWTDRKEARCADIRRKDLQQTYIQAHTEIEAYRNAENMGLLNKILSEME
jgi:hypothetical protein